MSAPTSPPIQRHRGIRRPSTTTSTSTSFLPRARSSKVSSVCRRHITPAIEQGRLTVAPWWNPVFEEHHHESFEPLRDEFRGLLRDATARQIEGANNIGCFLSGGTDSSTVAGMLTEVTGKPAQTFSIGFDAEGYDEMEYARIAARHFKTDHHEYYVTPDDLVTGIPVVAASYDQPFGNSSVVPAYYCAKAARDAGVDRILGGDGGDELFGGNTRYAKQRVFGTYDYVPRSLRRGIIEPLLLGSDAIGRLPVLRKAASYVEQARVPMPDRLQMYNLLGAAGAGGSADAGVSFRRGFGGAIAPAARHLRCVRSFSLGQQNAVLRLALHAGGQRSAQGSRGNRARRDPRRLPLPR